MRLECLHEKQKQTTVAMRAYLQMKSLKLTTEITQKGKQNQTELYRYLIVRTINSGQSAQHAEK